MKRVVAAAAVSSLIVLGACGSGADKPKVAAKVTTTTARADVTTSTTMPVTTTTAAPVATTTPKRATTPTTAKTAAPATATPVAVDLQARLLKNLPAGYVLQSDDVGDTGPSDLDKAADDDGGDDARAVLQSDGFTSGYQRMWLKNDDNAILEFIAQFSGESGADHYDQRLRASNLEPEEGFTVTPFAVNGIPGAAGYLGQDEDGPSALVMFRRGTFIAQIIVFGADANAAVANSLAQQQYNNLA